MGGAGCRLAAQPRKRRSPLRRPLVTHRPPPAPPNLNPLLTRPAAPPAHTKTHTQKHTHVRAHACAPWHAQTHAHACADTRTRMHAAPPTCLSSAAASGLFTKWSRTGCRMALSALASAGLRSPGRGKGGCEREGGVWWRPPKGAERFCGPRPEVPFPNPPFRPTPRVRAPTGVHRARGVRRAQLVRRRELCVAAVGLAAGDLRARGGMGGVGWVRGRGLAPGRGGREGASAAAQPQPPRVRAGGGAGGR